MAHRPASDQRRGGTVNSSRADAKKGGRIMMVQSDHNSKRQRGGARGGGEAGLGAEAALPVAMCVRN